MKCLIKSKDTEIIVKNSRFITSLIEIDEDSNIKELIESIKTKYPNATHYCYAYITKNNQKSSDDGEPGGTAGLPMLNVLLKNNLINVLAVTTRYFGGIKLGAGGLVRAYTKSLTTALENNTIEVETGYTIKIIINYDIQKELDYLLKDEEILKKDYQEQVTYYLNVQKSTYKFLSKYNPIIIKETYIKKNVD